MDKWYEQNGVDRAIFGTDYISSEFNTYLVAKSHKYVRNTQRKLKGVKMEVGLMKKSYCQWEQD